MVALNTAYAAPKNAADPKNRVGDFFYEDHASIGKNRWASRLNTQEKSCYHYETASGRSNWSNRDPINEFGFWPYRVKVLSDNDQLFLQQESNLYRYVDNDGIRLIDPLGLCPPSGCSYEPDVWNQPGVKENNNCYSYACNNMHGPPPLTNQPTPGGKPQPGGGGNPPLTCADITAAAKSDGLVDLNSNGCCPTGYHKVSLFIAPNVDYHWYREDSNGNWSHKPGNTDATNLDASGNPITDPSAADRDYSEAGGPNYNQDCGVLCSQS